MKRGDLYWVNFDPNVGSETPKKRPSVLIGATPINKARRTIVVVPLSTSPNSHPPLTIQVTCLDKTVVAVCDQIRAVDKARLLSKIGHLSDDDIKCLENGFALPRRTPFFVG